MRLSSILLLCFIALALFVALSPSKGGVDASSSSHKRGSATQQKHRQQPAHLPSQVDDSLSLEKISALLSSIPDPSRREEVALDLLSLMFDSEQSLKQRFSTLYAKGFHTKKALLNEFVNSVLPETVKNERLLHLDDASLNLLVSNANYCVACRSIKNLEILMCHQTYPPSPGTCIECGFLRSLTNVLCNLTCEVSTNPPFVGYPCLRCGIWFDELQALCGPPNCTNSFGPYYIGAGSPLGGDSSSLLFGNELDVDMLAPSTCVPCYNLYTGYQLLCDDLMDHCPSPSPSPSSTPSISASPAPPSASASASPSPSNTPTASISMSPTASISESSTPSASPTASPPPPPSPSPSSSSYYYYYYYNYGNELNDKLESAEGSGAELMSIPANSLTSEPYNDGAEACSELNCNTFFPYICCSYISSTECTCCDILDIYICQTRPINPSSTPSRSVSPSRTPTRSIPPSTTPTASPSTLPSCTNVPGRCPPSFDYCPIPDLCCECVGQTCQCTAAFSVTRTPTPTISITPSISHSRTPSRSRTPSSSPATASPSISRSPSASPLPSASAQPTCNNTEPMRAQIKQVFGIDLPRDPEALALAFINITYGNWCGGGHGGFQDCCGGQPCPACNITNSYGDPLGIITPECMAQCPPVDLPDSVCMNHDACTFQYPNNTRPPAPITPCCSPLCVLPQNYCPCDCYFVAEMRAIQASAYCDTQESYYSPLACNTFVNAAAFAFQCGLVQCFYNGAVVQTPYGPEYEHVCSSMGGGLFGTYQNCIAGLWTPR